MNSVTTKTRAAPRELPPPGGILPPRHFRALASLFDYLCDQNAVTHNPVRGVKRRVPETTEGKTPALGDAQARRLLAAPVGDTLKAKRDRAILNTAS